MQIRVNFRRFFKLLAVIGVFLILLVTLLAWLTGAMDGRQSAMNNTALPFYSDPSLRPRWDRWASWQSTARFSLLDERGQDVDQALLEKSPTIIGFFYAGCVSICPVSLEVLRGLDTMLEKNLGLTQPQFVLLTVTPEIDTPSALSNYAQRLRLPKDWHLMTGKPAQMHRLALSLLSDIRTPALGGEPPHAQRAFLLDTHRRIRGVYDASSMVEMVRMASDYQRLLQE